VVSQGARKARGALTPQPPKAMFYFVPEFKLSKGDFVDTFNTIADNHKTAATTPFSASSPGLTR
jgi:hypothetical protein